MQRTPNKRHDQVVDRPGTSTVNDVADMPAAGFLQFPQDVHFELEHPENIDYT